MDGSKVRWMDLCSVLLVPTHLTEKWWTILHDEYESGRRHYHTLTHIHDMILHMEKVKEKLHSLEGVALAIFFHDIIYDPKASDNEERSAEVFMKFAEECVQVSSSTITPNDVKDMILATKSHRTEAHTSDKFFGFEDIHYLLDCDMSILGQDRKTYEKYSAYIRQEYSHIDETLYCKRRISVLKKFLDYPKIFSTKIFYDLYEKTARSNIQFEIVSLAEKLD